MKPILNLKPYTIKRITSVDPVNGRVVLGTETTFPIVANMQPVSMKQLQALPEARRRDKVKRFFTSTLILVADDEIAGVRYNSDRIVLADGEYEMWQVDDWASDHFECWCSKVLP